MMLNKNCRNKKSIPDALAQFEELPNSAHIRLPVMIALFGVSKSTIWRCVKNGTIPSPRKLTHRTTCWNVGDVRAAIAERSE